MKEIVIIDGREYEIDLDIRKKDLVDYCDMCGNWRPITNCHDGNDYLTITNNQLLCKKCLD